MRSTTSPWLYICIDSEFRGDTEFGSALKHGVSPLALDYYDIANIASIHPYSHTRTNP